MEKKSSANKKRACSAAILTVMVMACVVLANAIAVIVVDRYNTKWDMTSDKMYELGDITREVVGTLNVPITLYAMNSERDFLGEIKEVLTRYRYLSPYITIQYVDPYENPTFIEQYRQLGIALEPNSIMVENGGRRKVFGMFDLYTFNSDMTAVRTFNAEQQITSAILYVTSDDFPTVAFTAGHNEERSRSLTRLFEKNNFSVLGDVTVSMEGVPDNVDILVICAPTRDFSYEEMVALDDFMIRRAGKLMVFLQPGTQSISVLEEFLAEWGIGVMSEVVLEKQNFVSSNPLNIVASYAQHPINAYFSENRYFTLMPATRALSVLFEFYGDTSVSPVLVSTGDAYGKIGTTIKSLEREPEDTAGPFVLALTSSMKVAGPNGRDTAQIFAAGSKSMYADDLMGNVSVANSDFLAQVIGWCAGDMEVVNIPPKSMTLPPLSIKTYQAFILSGIFILLVPLVILGYGIMVWVRRRHL